MFVKRPPSPANVGAVRVELVLRARGDVSLEAPQDLTAGLGLALERVTRIELA
jgi:hypothetical protein